MNTKNLLLSVALGLGVPAFSQPVLDATNSAPQIGQQTTVHMTPNYSGTIGTPGANQNWDFSTVGSGTSYQNDYISCSSSPDCSNNPGATIVMHDLSSDAYSYIIMDNSHIANKGIYGSSQGQTMEFQYSDPETYMYFPLAYNNTHSDSWAATAQLAGGMATIDRSGTTTVTADGYGTLKTPAGTFQNTLRVHMHQAYQDVMTVAGNTTNISYETDIYTWYQPGVHDRLLSIASIAINGAAASTSIQYTDETPNAIHHPNTDKFVSQIFPNPANDNINVQLSNTEDQIKYIRVVNILGQVVAKLSANNLHQTAHNTYSIQTATIPTGVYWLQITTHRGTSNQKVQIVR